jgi:hypothetical protein
MEQFLPPIFLNWNDISAKIVFPAGIRHGTVFKVSESVFKNLVDQL